MPMDEDTTEEAMNDTALGQQNFLYERAQNRSNALMYAANSFGSQSTENGLDVDAVLERAKKFEAYLNGE